MITALYALLDLDAFILGLTYWILNSRCEVKKEKKVKHKLYSSMQSVSINFQLPKLLKLLKFRMTE